MDAATPPPRPPALRRHRRRAGPDGTPLGQESSWLSLFGACALAGLPRQVPPRARRPPGRECGSRSPVRALSARLGRLCQSAAATLLDYLARYTHRVAISTERILAFDGRAVRLRWRDSEHHNKKRILTIDAITLLSRFVQHVLPRGFKRVRHYGLLAPARKASALAACRRYFGHPTPPRTPLSVQALLARIGRDLARCEVCGSQVVRIELIAAALPSRAPPPAAIRAASC